MTSVARRLSALSSRSNIRTPLLRAKRTYTELPRPPPKDQPAPETFALPSKPRQYYTRPQRDLPQTKSKWPLAIVLGTLGIGSWAAFIAYAANQEKLSSSVVRQLMETIRTSSELRPVLGEAIRFEPVWWLNGDPWISGAIYLMQGNVDLSFRLKGHLQSGTLYFTSIRKAKGEQFTP
ncbi:cytochrome oxidase complex assembly protein 1-domain-containing protein, partial [Amylocystis lapponica]